jgi:hypothetical protein
VGDSGGDIWARSDRAGGSPAASGVPRHRQQDSSAGVEGNEKLTALTGAFLLLGFAVEGLTILEVRRLLLVHVLVGALLIGPVLLKIAATGYRFMRYYTRAQPYVRKGPPSPLLRVLGPFVIATSLAVIGTGIALGIAGPGSAWLFLHKASFILWFAVMTVHVLNYAPRLPRMLAARSGGSGHGYGSPGDYGQRGARVVPHAGRPVPGGAARWLALVLSLVVGIIVAVVATELSTKWGVSL